MRLLFFRAGLALLLAGVAALCLTGCGEPQESSPDGGGPPGCELGFLGDPSLEPQMELTARGADGVAYPLADGDPIALIFPPQGGRVVFAGVRATNMQACGARLTGILRDLNSTKVQLDARTINLKPYGNGWGGSVDSDISTFANIPLCPNQWSATNIYGTVYELEVELMDRDKRMLKQIIHVTPACAEPEHQAQCECICRGGYMLGEMCTPAADAGADAP